MVQFHLFGRQDDAPAVRSVLEEALKGGKIGPFTVDRTFLGMEQEPGESAVQFGLRAKQQDGNLPCSCRCICEAVHFLSFDLTFFSMLCNDLCI